MSYEIKTIETSVDGNETLYIVYEVNGVVAGICNVTHLDKEIIYINEIFTLEVYRNQGIATTLITFILDLARENNKKAVSLGVDFPDNGLGKFYEHVGFKKSYCYPDDGNSCIYTYFI